MADQNTQNKDEQISEDDLDKIMQDIESEEEAPVAVAPAKGKVERLPVTNSKDTQSLKLELTGPINLKLCFSSGERSIEVFCTEDALVCRMADGTEFKIPTTGKKAKAA